MSQENSEQEEMEYEEQEIEEEDSVLQEGDESQDSQSNASEDNEENQDNKDSNSWGAQKYNYYQKDKQNSDSELEEEEVEEAQAMQQKLNQQLEFDNFFDGIDLKKSFQNCQEQFVLLATEQEKFQFDEKKIFQEKNRNFSIDLKNLTEEEKIEFLTKDSPELLSLLEESKQIINELQQFYEPVFENLSKLKIKNKKLKQFLKFKRETMLIYYQSLVFYVMLKAKGALTKDHPILVQIIKLKEKNEELKNCEFMFEEELNELQLQLKKLKNKEIDNNNFPKQKKQIQHTVQIEKKQKTTQQQPQKDKTNYKQQKLQKILNEVEDDQEEFRFKIGKQQKKKADGVLNLEEKFKFNDDIFSDDDNLDFENIKLDKKKKKTKKEIASVKQTPKISKDKGKFYKMEVAEEQGDEPRKIDQEILTHRGLIRKRKKIDRNSRVKLRQKFEKASVKQKYLGKVVRKKRPTYEGELTGIKSNLVKGVSLKN